MFTAKPYELINSETKNIVKHWFIRILYELDLINFVLLKIILNIASNPRKTNKNLTWKFLKFFFQIFMIFYIFNECYNFLDYNVVIPTTDLEYMTYLKIRER